MRPGSCDDPHGQGAGQLLSIMEEYSSGQTWGTGVWGLSKSSGRGPARGGTVHRLRSWEPAGRVGRSEGPQEGLQEQRWGHPHSPEARQWPSGQVSSSWVGKCCCCCLVAKSFPTFCHLMDCILHHLLEFAQIHGPHTFGAWRWPPSWAGTSGRQGGRCLVPPNPLHPHLSAEVWSRCWSCPGRTLAQRY